MRGSGCRKGGLVTYSKHKSIFEKGRKIAIQRNKERREASGLYHFPLNTPLTRELSELIGAFIGDGFTNMYAHHYIVQFTGHASLDQNYMTGHIAKFILDVSPKIKFRIGKKDNTMRLTIYSKEFHQLLTKRFLFPAGKKSYTVTIPDEILKAEKSILHACVRGIFDTDGCIGFDRRKTYRQPYMRIHLDMKSKKLIAQLVKILQEEGIKVTVTDQGERIQINGSEQVFLFVEKIGFSNERHLKKISLWRDLNSRLAVYETATLPG
jgi:hypothetical protein